MSKTFDPGLILAHAQVAAAERASELGLTAADTMTRFPMFPYATAHPEIIHILEVLLDRESYPDGHAEWVEDGVRKILTEWRSKEDLAQLKRNLGLSGKKRRSKDVTMRRETEIVSAILTAAVTGSRTPKKDAGDQLQADDREVQRAWKKWSPAYLQGLQDMQSTCSSPEEKSKIRHAIDILDPLRDIN